MSILNYFPSDLLDKFSKIVAKLSLTICRSMRTRLTRRFFLLVLTVFLIVTLYLIYNCKLKIHYDFFHKTKSGTILIPNIIHYIIFNQNSINFITYLSILSVLKVQKPSKICIHSNKHHFGGYYWNKLMLHETNTTIVPKYLEQPTHVYGQVLSSVYHSSDVARIYILRQYGGIYLDTDVVVVNSLNPLRYFEMVIGWPDDAYVGTQVLLAMKHTPFLELWLRGYKKYHPRDWYYNAGVVPTEILQTYPSIAHSENETLGVQNLLDKLHGTEKWDWNAFYTIHLLSRHHSVYKNLTEDVVKILPTNFGKIARWILH